MHLIAVEGKPYAVINGKDFTVLRWFDAGRAGPIFLQVAGRTPLHREDLPHDDWKVVTTGDRHARVWTAWRAPWFDTSTESGRRLAFLGASSTGSLFLLFRYLARRFALLADDATLMRRVGDVLPTWEAPFLYAVDRLPDTGVTDTALMLLDATRLDDAQAAARLLGLPLSDPDDT